MERSVNYYEWKYRFLRMLYWGTGFQLMTCYTKNQNHISTYLILGQWYTRQVGLPSRSLKPPWSICAYLANSHVFQHCRVSTRIDIDWVGHLEVPTWSLRQQSCRLPRRYSTKFYSLSNNFKYECGNRQREKPQTAQTRKYEVSKSFRRWFPSLILQSTPSVNNFPP